MRQGTVSVRPGDSQRTKVEVLLLTGGLLVVLALLVMAIIRQLPWPAALLPDIALPPPLAASATPPRALGSAAEWISAEDYPPASIRRGEEGRVRIALAIDEVGRTRGCTVLESSGHRRLDRAACGALERNARFEPARAGDGTPVPSRFERRVVWALPREPGDLTASHPLPK